MSTSSIHLQWIFLFRYRQHRDVYNIERISILHGHYCRFFFANKIVDIATLTMLNRYRVYIVDITDFSLTLTSSALQRRRCWTNIEFTLSKSRIFPKRLNRRHRSVDDTEPILILHWSHWRHFFDVDIVNIAMYTTLNLHRGYIF